MRTSSMMHQQASRLLYRPNKPSPLSRYTISAADVGDDDSSDYSSESELDVASPRLRTHLPSLGLLPIDPALEDTANAAIDFPLGTEAATELTNRDESESNGSNIELRAGPSSPDAKRTLAGSIRFARSGRQPSSVQTRAHGPEEARLGNVTAADGYAIRVPEHQQSNRVTTTEAQEQMLQERDRSSPSTTNPDSDGEEVLGPEPKLANVDRVSHLRKRKKSLERGGEEGNLAKRRKPVHRTRR